MPISDDDDDDVTECKHKTINRKSNAIKSKNQIKMIASGYSNLTEAASQPQSYVLQVPTSSGVTWNSGAPGKNARTALQGPLPHYTLFLPLLLFVTLFLELELGGPFTRGPLDFAHPIATPLLTSLPFQTGPRSVQPCLHSGTA